MNLQRIATLLYSTPKCSFKYAAGINVNSGIIPLIAEITILSFNFQVYPYE